MMSADRKGSVRPRIARRAARLYHSRLMWLLLDCVYIAAAMACLPLLAYQRFVLGKRRGGWKQRLGHLPLRPGTKPSVWIHAVSLGETNATRGIVEALRRDLPDHDVVISTTTDTGYARAVELYPDLYVFRYPLDFSWAVRRAIRTVRPSVIVLMELEVWPNLVLLAERRGIPVVVANGRLTEERSMRRFRRPILRQVAHMVFRRLAWVGAQNQAYAERFLELGVPRDRVHVTGVLKWDTAQIADTLPGTDTLRDAVGIRRPLWVFGQSGPGEEAVALAAFDLLRREFPDLQLAIIPRKPERFEEVASRIAGSGRSWVRRSRCPDGTAAPGRAPDVILGDTMGELRKFYCLADAVFVGRTLVPMGGSDVIEVAALAKPILVGPHTENFADAVAALAAAGGLEVCVTTVDAPDAAEQVAAVVRSVLSGGRGTAMGLAARRVVQENQGVTQRTVAALTKLVKCAQQ